MTPRLPRDRPVYVDIDGTLTDTPGRPDGQPYANRIQRLRELMHAGYQVVLWTGGGTAYARRFARQHGLDDAICLGKPGLCVDDNPALSPSMQYAEPGWLDTC